MSIAPELRGDITAPTGLKKVMIDDQSSGSFKKLQIKMKTSCALGLHDGLNKQQQQYWL